MVRQQQWDELEEPLKQAVNVIRKQIACNSDNLKEQFVKSRCGDHEEKPVTEEYKKKKRRRDILKRYQRQKKKVPKERRFSTTSLLQKALED